MDAEEFAALLLRVARQLGMAVRPSGHDPQEWRFTTADGEEGTVLRLGAGGAATLLRAFSPFDPAREKDLAAAERHGMGTRIEAIARTVDSRVQVDWQPADLTAVLRLRVQSPEVGEEGVTGALAALEDVVETSREEALAVAQGVAAALPVDPGPAPRRPGAAVPVTVPADAPPHGYSSQLVPAILTTIFCCMPLGIASIVFAAKAQGLANQGDYAAAAQAAGTAKTLWIISAALVGVGFLMALFASLLSHSGF